MVKGEAINKFSSSIADVSHSGSNSDAERRATRKLDRNLLPILTVFMFMSFIDRINIGNARVAGLERSLGLTERQYKICVSTPFVPYVLSEIPTNLILRYVGPRWLLPTIITAWGVITIFQGLVTNFSGLLAVRFFLGLTEGPMIPCVTLYLSAFYTRQELGLRIATFFTGSSLAGAFSGLLAAGISKMSGIGGRPGWAWIFILEGILTSVIGFSGFFLIPSTPAEANFLTPEEKDIINARLEKDRPILLNGGYFRLKEIGRALLSPHVVLLSISAFFAGVTIFGLAIFMPTIINTLGFTPIISQLLAVGPFTAAFLVTIFASWASDNFKSRMIPIACSVTLSAIGYIIYLLSHDRFILYGSLFFTASGLYSIPPIGMAWISNNSEPHYRRATAIALSAVFTNIGGILGAWMFPISEAPRYKNASIINLIFILLVGLTAIANGLLLCWWNKRKQDPVRRQKTLAPYYQNTKVEVESGFSRIEDANQSAWLDLGDRHPDFRYVI